MSTMYTQPRPSRTKSWKLAAAGGAALLVLVVGALAYPLMSGDAAETPAPAEATTTAPAQMSTTATPSTVKEEPLATQSLPAKPAATPARSGTMLSIGVASGAPGVPVDTPVRLTGAEGLGSASLRVMYDPNVVRVVNIQNGEVPQSALRWHHDEPSGVIVMLLTTSLAEGVKGDHDFALLTFEAKSGAVGETSALKLDVRGGALADGSEATLTGGSGSFRNGVPGDVIGDGTVDQADYDRLADFLVGESDEIIMLNADLDGDGAVTDADAVRLHQFLDGTREEL